MQCIPVTIAEPESFEPPRKKLPDGTKAAREAVPEISSPRRLESGEGNEYTNSEAILSPRRLKYGRGFKSPKQQRGKDLFSRRESTFPSMTIQPSMSRRFALSAVTALPSSSGVLPWRKDPAFFVEKHVHAVEHAYPHLTRHFCGEKNSKGGGKNSTRARCVVQSHVSLQELLEAIAAEPISVFSSGSNASSSTSPWECLLIKSVCDRGSVLVFRFHHAIAAVPDEVKREIKRGYVLH